MQRVNACTLATPGVTDPYKLGLARGYLEAMTWLARLPEQMAELQEQRELSNSESADAQPGAPSRLRKIVGLP